ncbi:MAG: hypothetical protein V3U82_02380 [Robiginitomaculum sp.]
MAGIWDTLGLDGPTEDIKTIKRAYARRLKLTRPDEDPEGFMQLRDAFTWAKNHASYHAQEAMERPASVEISDRAAEKTQEPQEPQGQWPQEIESVIAPAGEGKAEISLQADTELTILLSKVEALLDSPIERNKDAVWGVIFKHINALPIDDYAEFCHHFQYMLINRIEEQRHKEFKAGKTPRKETRTFTIEPKLARKIFATLGWLHPMHNPSEQHNIDQLAKYFEIIENPFSHDNPNPRQEIKAKSGKGFPYGRMLGVILMLAAIANLVGSVIQNVAG